jgi:hypothetical protein
MPTERRSRRASRAARATSLCEPLTMSVPPPRVRTSPMNHKTSSPKPATAIPFAAACRLAVDPVAKRTNAHDRPLSMAARSNRIVPGTDRNCELPIDIV